MSSDRLKAYNGMKLVVNTLIVYVYVKVQVGLCYLPVAFGSLSGVGSSRIIDWNFKREARKQG